MNTTEFLEELYYDVSDGWLAIHRKGQGPRKKFTTEWINPMRPEEISAIEIPERENVYFSVGLRNKKTEGRGETDAVLALPALWLDIDVKSQYRKNQKRYPETMGAARRFIDNELPLKPSILINSGYGYHVYYLIDGMIKIHNNASRQKYLTRAINYQLGWNRFVARRAREYMNWDIDICDIAGVLRLPGSFNWKSNKAEMVKIVNDPCERYSTEAFDDYIIKESSDSVRRKKVTIDFNTPVPDRKLEVLLAADEKFANVYNKRHVFPNDNSDSSYCCSIMHTLVAAGWTDSEVVAVVKHWREHHRSKKKPESWYQKEIGKIREVRAQYNVPKRIEEEHENENPEGILKELSTLIGKKVQNIERHVPITSSTVGEVADISYTIYVAGANNIFIPTTAELLSFVKFKTIVAGLYSKVIHRQKADDWDKIVQAILYASETVRVASEESKYGIIEQALSDYRSDAVVKNTLDDFFAARVGRVSILEHEGKVWFKFLSFREWLLQRGNAVNIKDLGRLLQHIGCKKQAIRIGPKKLQKSMWSFPKVKEDSDE